MKIFGYTLIVIRSMSKLERIALLEKRTDELIEQQKQLVLLVEKLVEEKSGD